jgi:hypothetical protein
MQNHGLCSHTKFIRLKLSGGKRKGGEACAMWYDEIKYYDFTTGKVKAGSPPGAVISECCQ